jgi:hypothetical protein
MFDYRVINYIPTPPDDSEFYVALEKLAADIEDRTRLQLASIPLLQSPERWDRFGFDPTLANLEKEANTRGLEAQLEEERRSGPRRWVNGRRWSERIRLALPQRWGILDRAMRGRW